MTNEHEKRCQESASLNLIKIAKQLFWENENETFKSIFSNQRKSVNWACEVNTLKILWKNRWRIFSKLLRYTGCLQKSAPCVNWNNSKSTLSTWKTKIFLENWDLHYFFNLLRFNDNIIVIRTRGGGGAQKESYFWHFHLKFTNIFLTS